MVDCLLRKEILWREKMLPTEMLKKKFRIMINVLNSLLLFMAKENLCSSVRFLYFIRFVYWSFRQISRQNLGAADFAFHRKQQKNDLFQNNSCLNYLINFENSFDVANIRLFQISINDVKNERSIYQTTYLAALKSAMLCCFDTDIVVVYFQNTNSVEFYRLLKASFYRNLCEIIAFMTQQEKKEHVMFFVAKEYERDLKYQLFCATGYKQEYIIDENSAQFFISVIEGDVTYRMHIYNLTTSLCYPWDFYRNYSIDKLVVQSLNWILKRQAFLVAQRISNGKYFEIFKFIVEFL